MIRVFFPLVTLLALAAVGCGQAVDPYFDQVAEEQDKLVEKSTVIIDGMNSDLDACALAVFSSTACDRAIDKFDEFRSAVEETRVVVNGLEPPPEASEWHQDYLTYLRDSSAWANRVVTAYYGGDAEAFLEEVEKLDTIAEDEDRLVDEFEAIQKEMGAR